MNKKKLKWIIGAASAFLVLAYAAAVLFTAQLSVTVTGEAAEILPVGSEYTDAGANAEVRFPLLFGYTAKLETESEGDVQKDLLGEYTCSYKAGFLFTESEAVRTVRVVDTEAPVIEVFQQTFDVDASAPPTSADSITVGYEAYDNYDGDVTSLVKKELRDGVCYYTVSDSSGNAAEAQVKLVYLDHEKPVIKLKGSSTVYLALNSSYKEFGYTVSDNYDKDIASRVSITKNVDMSKNGSYTVTYSVTDSAGNTSQINRRVIVYGGGYDTKYDTVAPNGKVIYMTFDDGPGKYTEQLLNTLQSYNTKATFFVTNQFPKYQPLITRMSNEGHTVAVHTLTHKWDIYNSVEAYMNDFNAMNSIIERLTGKPTRFFRFPGGTGNTVSRKHCSGIMTALSKQMTDMGYVYFDWNVGSQDTYLTEPSDIINTLINQISNKSQSIILMHDIKKATVEAVPGFIEYCLKNGYTFRAIDDTTKPYQTKPKN